MPDTRGLIASGANELNFASVQGHFLSNDTAVGNLDTGLAVAFNLVDTFDDNFGVLRHGGNNFALLTLILAGEDLNGIAFFYVKFNERQPGNLLSDELLANSLKELRAREK
jgi:hypothetical protein